MNFENDLLVPMSTSKYAIEYDVGDRLPEDDYQSIIEMLQIKFCQLPWSPRSIANVIYVIHGNMTLKEYMP